MVPITGNRVKKPHTRKIRIPNVKNGSWLSPNSFLFLFFVESIFLIWKRKNRLRPIPIMYYACSPSLWTRSCLSNSKGVKSRDADSFKPKNSSFKEAGKVLTSNSFDSPASRLLYFHILDWIQPPRGPRKGLSKQTLRPWDNLNSLSLDWGLETKQMPSPLLPFRLGKSAKSLKACIGCSFLTYSLRSSFSSCYSPFRRLF